MPVSVSYPGVYIEEIPSGVRTITGVATSIAAFVGAAPRGPVGTPTTIFSFADYQRIFGGLSLSSTVSYAVNDFFANGGSQAIIVRLVNGDAKSAVYELTTTSTTANDFLTLNAASPGTWGNNLTITVDTNTKDTTNKNLFNLTIAETNGAVEVFRNISSNPTDPSYIAPVLQQGSLLVSVVKNGLGDIPTAAPTGSQTVTTATTPGSDGSALTATQVIGSQANKTGIYGLDKADLFNIVVIPPPTSTTDTPPAVWQAAAAYCQTRRAMLLVDAPSAWSAIPETAAQTALAGLAGLGITGTIARNAALYFPLVSEADPLHNYNSAFFPPSGAIAGIYARTDATRGVWKAPAGVDATLNGSQGLSVNVTDAENGLLNPLAINCLRTFATAGQVVWGARTLAGADQLEDDYKYVPVRRLALYIEESLYRGTQWAVFEPNDEPLWGQIRTSIGSFMQQLFVQGAFQGSSRQNAYFVKCDSETTTQTDVNNGIVNIIVGFAPLKPAEFVVLQIQQLAGQS
jgi:phage tail sheath protein FI